MAACESGYSRTNISNSVDGDAESHDFMTDTILPSELVMAARVKCARFVPWWMSKRRWLVLRGSKSPILSVYRQDPRRLENHAPVQMLLLGKDTRMRVAGKKRLVLVSSRVRKDDTLSVEFDSSEQRQVVYATLSQWVALAVLLQRLTIHESMAKKPNSTVYLCHDCYDPMNKFVLKRIHGSHGRTALSRTTQIMALNREHYELGEYLAQYFYLYEDTKAECATVIMKYYSGGSLADRIRECGSLPEALACRVLVLLCKALRVLHEHQMLHLNIKASNIFFDDSPNGNFCNLKIVDFGNGTNVFDSDDIDDNWENIEDVESYGYMTTTQYQDCCDPETDVYGAGIVLYHMLSGTVPFLDAELHLFLTRNVISELDFAGKVWQNVSPQMRSLTARMLDRNPVKRITLAEILSLSWLSQEFESIHTV
ncbi:putative protein kinase [Plasmopara halstedii]